MKLSAMQEIPGQWMPEQWKEMLRLFYDRTNQHIGLVQKYAEIIYYRFDQVSAELIARSRGHDASKFLAPEFVPYVFLTWSKSKNIDLASLFNEMPTICQMYGYATAQELINAVREATKHHITSNMHHPEYHTEELNTQPRDSSQTNGAVSAEKMGNISLAEMCADWAAMSEELGTDLVGWVDQNIGTRWKFHPLQKVLIKDFLGACIANG